jgi:hypothetical protein
MSLKANLIFLTRVIYSVRAYCNGLLRVGGASLCVQVEVKGFGAIVDINKGRPPTTDYELSRVVWIEVRASPALAGKIGEDVFRCVASAEVAVKEQVPGTGKSSKLCIIAADDERGGIGWMRMVSVCLVRAV